MKVVRERDSFRDEVKEMRDHKVKLEKEKASYTLQTKDTINKLNKDIKKLTDQRDEASDAFFKADTELK